MTGRGTYGHLRHMVHLHPRTPYGHTMTVRTPPERPWAPIAHVAIMHTAALTARTRSSVPHAPTTRNPGATIAPGTSRQDDPTGLGDSHTLGHDAARTLANLGRLQPRRVRGRYERAPHRLSHTAATQRRLIDHVKGSCKGAVSGGRVGG